MRLYHEMAFCNRNGCQRYWHRRAKIGRRRSLMNDTIFITSKGVNSMGIHYGIMRRSRPGVGGGPCAPISRPARGAIEQDGWSLRNPSFMAHHGSYQRKPLHRSDRPASCPVCLNPGDGNLNSPPNYPAEFHDGNSRCYAACNATQAKKLILPNALATKYVRLVSPESKNDLQRKAGVS